MEKKKIKITVKRDVYVSYDGDKNKGLEIWDSKPQWKIPPVDRNPQGQPYFTTSFSLNPSSIYLSLHSPKTGGIEKGKSRKAEMTITLHI